MENIQQTSLHDVQTALEKVSSFLIPYLPLANAHNSDFIISGYWNTNIPTPIANELLQLSPNDLALLPNGHIEACSSNSSISEDSLIYKHQVPQSISSNESESWKLHSDSMRLSWDKSLVTKWTHRNLTSFIEHATLNTLPRLAVLTPLQYFTNEKLSNQCMIGNFMSPKKSHEVQVMASICTILAKHYKLSKVIDIGSGRGYLGCQLALAHNLYVLGVDSSSSNSESATARTAKLACQWEGLVRNALKRRSEKQDKPDDANKDILEPSHDIPSRTEHTANSDTCSASYHSTQKHLSVSYVPVTRYITSDVSLTDLITSHCDWPPLQNEERLLLTGLHTCGELADSTLQLFNSSDDAAVVCNVGCCYHLLEELYLCSPYSNQDEPTSFGFPMSSYLKQRHFRLGRNARMLASQAPARLAESVKLPDKSIFWRALLQVILRDVTGMLSDEWQVGKIAAKCDSFITYVQRAFVKLSIAQPVPSIEKIQEYEAKYADYEHKMVSFFQLKAVLAPCIEAVILLDRLCFLLEQDNTCEAHIVQLFDSVTSPRCYAVIATKQPFCHRS